MLDRLGRDVVALKSERMGEAAEPRHIRLSPGGLTHVAALVGLLGELSA